MAEMESELGEGPTDNSHYDLAVEVADVQPGMQSIPYPMPARLHATGMYPVPENSWSTGTPVSMTESYSQLGRLNGKAASFQPQEVNYQPINQHYKKGIAEVIRLTHVALKKSEHVKNVEVSKDQGCWSINIMPNVVEENTWQTELLITLAKEALLEAAGKSKCIYVMGYCAPQPFTTRAQGFQLNLGAMLNAASACWHVFKKGFCRHGETCNKQHPACQVPVHVVVEGVQLGTCERFADAFKEQVADLARIVTEALGDDPHVELVEAFKDKDYQGWTIELTANQDLASNKDYKDYLLTLAKNTLFGASGNSELLYIIGYAEKPFQWKPRGFVAILGDMQDEATACWDMYSKGMCTRACGACQWAHPECLMPFNVIVKETSYPAAIELP